MLFAKTNNFYTKFLFFIVLLSNLLVLQNTCVVSKTDVPVLSNVHQTPQRK